ncbi:hypothetical protein GCM10011318_20970 [Phaeocystidibacter marisrubri]|uniref:DUF4625 domain-containing protein n=2 Tax=Phaeocystidibacter marisrubri TaxID=1577780 RepID=A0A6L3ZIA2_9FLAO|nr:DUF4625 domain-containing protein [Phaeocystidibacter marisrubri]GGH74706.1 hypothetical protein GCM10011318_20970 [Phaeocystidibacter marisrubri]
MSKMRLLIVPFALLTLVSCTKDKGDTTPPKFVSATVQGESENPIYLNAGTAIGVMAEVSDNEALKQVKIDLHDDFDGHDHNKAGFTPWTYVNIISVNGKSAVAVDTTIIPEEATAGVYHAVLRVLDKAGNEGEFVEKVLIIKNGSEPIISVTAPDFSATPQFAPGDVISLAGSISDVDEFEEIHILLRQQEDVDHYITFGEREFDLADQNVSSFDLSAVSLTIPTDAKAGEYEVAIIAVDKLGNQGIYYGHLRVE